jgi:23S rRNA G2069 N7-methylase RlmK/C1962 C5-methylase RlmI
MRRLLHSALAGRGEAAQATDRVVRLVSGAADGLPGLTLDRLGAFVFGSSKEALLAEELAALESLVEPLCLSGLEVRRRAPGGRGVERHLFGQTPPEVQWLADGPAEALIQLRPDSLSYGLFPDLAAERRMHSEQAAVAVQIEHLQPGTGGAHRAALGGQIGKQAVTE